LSAREGARALGLVFFIAAVLILPFGALWLWLTSITADVERCTKACHPVVSRRIHGECHCATQTGWDRVGETVTWKREP
jgi:hypothetical protein